LPVTNANRVALKSLARRVLELDDEIVMLDEFLTPFGLPDRSRDCR